MSPQPSDDSKQAAKTAPSDSTALPITDAPKSPDVPVFSCIVYVSPQAGGGVHVRVANLPGLECDAANEREALRTIVANFKQRLKDLLQSKTTIPWIEPPSAAQPGEQKRFIPVHL
jgi:hypothetical protein